MELIQDTFLSPNIFERAYFLFHETLRKSDDFLLLSTYMI